MLTNERVEGLRVAFERLADPITEYIVRDVARRVSQAGQFTSSAAYQIWRAQNLGKSRNEIEREVAAILKKTVPEVRELFKQAAEVGYNFDIDHLTREAIPFEENTSVQQIVDAAVKLADENFRNITQTIGFQTTDGSVHPMLEAYQRTTDYAFQQVITGATDYNTAIRQACKKLADGGVKTIDYASGVHTSLEAAIRRNMMGGLGLMVEQISQSNHDELGANGWELSAHANSAPDHEPIQGKQYTDAEYEALNNSLVRRIGTLNCGHNAFPIMIGVSAPQYTKEQLEKFREDNEKGVTVDGKHYTGYEATQMQRKIERAIRRQKRRVMAAEASGDKDTLATAKTRLQLLRQEYSRFSKAAGLRTENERLHVSGFGRKQAAKTAPKPAPAPEPVQRTAKNYVAVPVEKWYPDAKPNSHPVQDLLEYTHEGVTYKVGGTAVQLTYGAHEKEIAELLEREVGGEIYMVPRINIPQGIRTPDYLFHGRKYDLKTLKPSDGKNKIFNRVKNAIGQATCFIIDVTDSSLDDATIDSQIDKIFWSKDTQFVDEVVVIKRNQITKILKRAKKGADTPSHLVSENTRRQRPAPFHSYYISHYCKKCNS